MYKTMRELLWSQRNVAGRLPSKSKEIAELNEVVETMIYDVDINIHNEAVWRYKDLANAHQNQWSMYCRRNASLTTQRKRSRFWKNIENTAEEGLDTLTENDMKEADTEDKEIAQKKLKILTYFEKCII